MMNHLILYTIGHSNISRADFLMLLRQHHITVLVDVRSAPYSRYVPHFNKAALEAFLVENGINYKYAGEYLGGLPKDEGLYKDQQKPGEDAERSAYLGQVDYVAVMRQDEYLRGIRRLLDIVAETAAQGGNVTIMCSEANPHDCHRHHLITRSLLDPAVKVVAENVQVRHILRDGGLETVESTVFQRQPRLL
ncbi:MAG TPA: DUF488 domain-containing protein [Phototrophicaceae bacterium]|nr:DUF488 domain-containing protein [Phototrophicaceae bacterium]